MFFSSWKKKSVKQNTAPVRYPSLCQTKNNLMYTPLNHEKLVASWQTSCVYFRLQILYIQGFGIPTPDFYITRYILPATTSCSHPRWFAVLSMLKFTPWKFDSLNLQKDFISKFGISFSPTSPFASNSHPFLSELFTYFIFVGKTIHQKKLIHIPWKWMVGILVSFWDGPFSGANCQFWGG